jgi:hypothetical protein
LGGHGVIFQLVGQAESNSTMLKPRPSSCTWKHFFMAFLAFLMFFTESREQRST